MKKLFITAVTLGSVLLMPAVAMAHVVVTPAQAGIGSFQTFTTGVPAEKPMATVGLKLVLPAGLQEVAPNVKPGWDINVVKNGDNVTEIDWTNGSIPSGQRDDFAFSAQVPGSPTTLKWKAYQTYADGSVVAWDQTPNGTDDDSFTPYSETKVIDDLTKPAAAAKGSGSSNGLAIAAIALSVVALAVSVASSARKQ